MKDSSTKTSAQFTWAMVLIALGSCIVRDPALQPTAPVLPTILCSPQVRVGFTDKISYYPGEEMTVFLQARDKESSCRLDIYDVNGNVALSVPSRLFPQTSPDTTFAGYDYQPSTKITIPENLVSGLYLIEHKIPVVIKSRAPVDLTVVYPINTVNAYCSNGGKSLYSPNERPGSVSYLRPMALQTQCEECLKWFPSQSGLRIGYVSDLDLDFYSSIKQSKILVIIGHSEYWTREGRNNFDRFVNEGGHALILSGNTMWWQVRYSDDRTRLICYKDAQLDPEINPSSKTINWDRADLNYPILTSIGADFPHGGYGLTPDAGWDGFKIVNPASPLLKNTGLQKGDTLSMPSGEYDGAPILNFDPDGYPIVDKSKLKFGQVELIGFDRASRGGTETIGTFIVLKKSRTSGVIINGASYDWCSDRGMGGDSGPTVKKITRNAIDLLLKNKSVFSN